MKMIVSLDIDTIIVNMKSVSMMMPICIKQHLSDTEAQFMKKLSNTEAELKKSVTHKKTMQSTLKFVNNVLH